MNTTPAGIDVGIEYVLHRRYADESILQLDTYRHIIISSNREQQIISENIQQSHVCGALRSQHQMQYVRVSVAIWPGK